MDRPVGDDVLDRLARRLEQLPWTHDAVSDLLGVAAASALVRDETTPALRVTRGGSPLETLVRLWALQVPVGLGDAERALPGLVAPLVEAAFLERDGDEVRALLDVSPLAVDETDLLCVNDLTPGLDGARPSTPPDYVLGTSPAGVSLAQITSRDHAARALDLGTGCGIQALHLVTHCDRVVATDVNPHALHLARVNARLNRTRLPTKAVEVREGSWFDPVAGERFDLVVSNPPFVISPAAEAAQERLVYRDSGVPGDAAVERLLRDLPAHLSPGGRAHVLTDWAVHRGSTWEERLVGPEGMLSGLGCHAWVLQREVVEPPAYVELWLKDSGHHGGPDYRQRYDAWLDWFEAHDVEAVGFGWVSLQDAAGATPVVRTEEWPWEVEQPVAPAFGAWVDAVTWLAAADDDAVLRAHLLRRDDVRQETYGEPGAEDPEVVLLRQQRLLRRGRQVDTVEAALVGACDGDLAVGQVLDALAGLTGTDPRTVRAQYLPVVRELVEEGFLQRSGPAVEG